MYMHLLQPRYFILRNTFPPDNKIVNALKNPRKSYIIDGLVNFTFANQRFHIENTPVSAKPVNKLGKFSDES